MGDGNIVLDLDKETRVASQNKAPQDDETPRCFSPGSSTPAECSTPTSPTSPQLEELHRNTTNSHSVLTPAGLSSIDIHTPENEQGTQDEETPRRGRRNFHIGEQPHSAENEFGLPFGPAAGLGPQDMVPHLSNQAIFSVRGTRSFKINRHRDCVSVFPEGCMGVKNEDDEHVIAEVPVVEEPVAVGTPSPPLSPSIVTPRPNSGARNPLTGEGYGDKDYKRQTGLKKRAEDGNPVLGHGYDPAKNSRGTKVPPGGFSKGLW